jgi:hypothetical protein
MELSDWSLGWNLPGPELENKTFSKKNLLRLLSK